MSRWASQRTRARTSCERQSTTRRTGGARAQASTNERPRALSDALRPSPLPPSPSPLSSSFPRQLVARSAPLRPAMFEMEQDEELAELWCVCGQRIIQPKPASSRRASTAAAASLAGKITPTPVTFKRSKTGTIRVRSPPPVSDPEQVLRQRGEGARALPQPRRTRRAAREKAARGHRRQSASGRLASPSFPHLAQPSRPRRSVRLPAERNAAHARERLPARLWDERE